MPVRQLRWAAVLTGLLLAAGCAQPAGPGPGAPPVSTPAVVPFATFLAGVTAARYRDYAGRPGTAVRDRAAFEQMRRYLLRRYRATAVSHSLASGDAVIDCVRAPGRPVSPPDPATAPSPPPPAATATATDHPPAPAAGCPEGTVPVRRVTLDELVRFPTLADFLAKGPGRESLPPTR